MKLTLQKQQNGFTLLELLVAMTIFAFMSIMAYGGLSNVLTSNEVITEQEQKLKVLQRSMMIMERDFRQMAPRPRRTGYTTDERSPALTYGLDSEGLIEFTTAGNSNFLGLPRSSLQRVRYTIEEQQLKRFSWSLVDHIDAEPVTMNLLEDIEAFEIKLLNKSNAWQENWSQATELPIAVEVTMTHKTWGKIVRLLPIK